MSPSVYITRRVRKRADGKRITRYVVRYRLGGRESQPMHAGSFARLEDARVRERWVAGELAQMRVPDLRALAAVTEAPTVERAVKKWIEERRDLSPESLRAYGYALERMKPHIGKVRVSLLTEQHVVDLVGALHAEKRSRKTIEQTLSVLRGALDKHRKDNPGRSRDVRLPHTRKREPTPPPLAHFRAMVETVPPALRLPLEVLEATGLRVGELVGLTWGDIDAPGERLRVQRRKTAKSRRWVPVPAELMRRIEALVAREDRELDAALWPGLTPQGVRDAVARACKARGIPHYTPHDLRRRYISVQLKAGDPVALAQRVGHARTSMTLDTYGFVVLDDPEDDEETP